MRYSLPQNIVRYSNGTLVKLTVSDHQFISYDYDPETDTGTYTPTSIKITAKYAGNLTYSKWQYTKDNSGWVDIPASNDLGITITSTTLTIVPSSSLFDKVNSFIMFRVVATDNDTGEEYTDTAEIERIVDYIILYRKQQTDIDQTADKIALIASDEQLRQYGTDNTVVSDLAALKVTAQGISSTVSSHTAALAKKANTSDVNAALANKADTTYVSENYSTKTQTAQEITQAVSSKVGEDEVRSLIAQSADAIRLMARALSWTSDNSSLTEAGFLTITGGQIANLAINANGLTYDQKIDYINWRTMFRVFSGSIQTRSLTNVFSGVNINGQNGLEFLYADTAPSDPWDPERTTKTGYIMPIGQGLIICTAVGPSIEMISNIMQFRGSALFYDGVSVLGNLVVTGRKTRMVRTDNYQDRLLFCYETPTPLFGDIGEAVLDEEGLCYVDIDDIFSETIADRVEYQVFLQKEGEGECWIADKQPRFFVIKGTPGLKVAWELKAKQKGYETLRLEQYGRDLDEYERADDQESLLDSYIKEQEGLLYG